MPTSPVSESSWASKVMTISSRTHRKSWGQIIEEEKTEFFEAQHEQTEDDQAA